MTARARCAVIAALLGLLAVTGCTTLPVSGPVRTRTDTGGDSANQAPPYFAPPGPAHDADPTSIVNGFLLAIQANPPSTAVARSFLADSAKATWKPVQGTTIYDGSTVTARGDQVRARLTGAHRLDPGGDWVGGPASSSVDLPFSLIRQNGQWRILNPPSALPVPTSYFRSLYAPYTLYFYDRSGTVLVPTQIYLPRGDQIASNLVRGLLAGPGADVGRWARTAFGPGIGLVASVITNDDGVAEVPFGPEVQRLAPSELHRLVMQLAWTLRQVPGIARLRVTADGVAVAMPGGQSDLSLSDGLDFDPITAPSLDLAAISGGRIVTVTAAGTRAAAGPLARPGFALRSLARSTEDHRYAAVAGDGRRLFEAADSGNGAVRTVLSGAQDLLRPSYDRFGNLWAVDASRSGAVVHLIDRRGHDRVLDIAGISGRRITAFTVTRDGSRFVAGWSSPTTSLAVSGIERADRGRVTRVFRAQALNVDGLEGGPVLDLGQDSGTTVAVLSRTTSGTRRILSVELDGSLPFQVGVPDPIADPLVTLLVSPDPRLARQGVSSDDRLLELSGSGQWVKVASGILTAAYPQ